MRDVREIADRLYAESERVGFRANVEREQGNEDLAILLAQIEMGLGLVAHVFEAVHEDLEGDDE